MANESDEIGGRECVELSRLNEFFARTDFTGKRAEQVLRDRVLHVDRPQEVSCHRLHAANELIERLIEALANPSSRVLKNREVHMDLPFLSKPVDAIGGLGFHSRIPPSAVVNDVIRLDDR